MCVIIIIIIIIIIIKIIIIIIIIIMRLFKQDNLSVLRKNCYQKGPVLKYINK